MPAVLAPSGLAGSSIMMGSTRSTFAGRAQRVSVARPASTKAAVRVATTASLEKRTEEVAEGAKKMYEKLAAPAMSLALAATLMTGFAPDDAMAARSSGRVGGGNFSGRSAPRARAAPQSRTTVNNVYVAPPIYGGGFGYGMSPFGFSPFGFGMGFMGFGTILRLMIFVAILNVVLSFVQNLGNSNTKGKDDDDFFE